MQLITLGRKVRKLGLCLLNKVPYRESYFSVIGGLYHGPLLLPKWHQQTVNTSIRSMQRFLSQKSHIVKKQFLVNFVTGEVAETLLWSQPAILLKAILLLEPITYSHSTAYLVITPTSSSKFNVWLLPRLQRKA